MSVKSLVTLLDSHLLKPVLIIYFFFHYSLFHFTVNERKEKVQVSLRRSRSLLVFYSFSLSSFSNFSFSSCLLSFASSFSLCSFSPCSLFHSLSTVNNFSFSSFSYPSPPLFHLVYPLCSSLFRLVFFLLLPHFLFSMLPLILLSVRFLSFSLNVLLFLLPFHSL